MAKTAEVSREKLVADLKLVVGDAEELLRLTADQAGEKVSEVRGRLTGRLSSARQRLSDLESSLVEQTKKVADATDSYVHEKPWQAIGVAAGIAFLLGLLSSRR